MESTAYKNGSSRPGDCGCGGGGRTVSAGSYAVGGSGSRGGFAFGTLERPRYYPRQLMTPDDLNLEAAYVRDRMRRHNLFLHGWGVVCGALVCTVAARKRTETAREDYLRRRSELKGAEPASGFDQTTEPWLLRIQPGYVIGPYGDEIVIDQPVEVSLLGNGTSLCGRDAADDTVDPWCTEVYEARRRGPVYVAVKYRECLARPVASMPGGCDCADEPCEYSRYRDGFEIGFLDCCPDSHMSDSSDGFGEYGRGSRNPVCPDCPDSPWVVLAKVEVDDSGDIQVIDNCDCRRIMLTTRDRWTTCSGSDCDDGTYERDEDELSGFESFALDFEPTDATAEPASAEAGGSHAARAEPTET